MAAISRTRSLLSALLPPTALCIGTWKITRALAVKILKAL
jgi:hypothetical protein